MPEMLMEFVGLEVARIGDAVGPPRPKPFVGLGEVGRVDSVLEDKPGHFPEKLIADIGKEDQKGEFDQLFFQRPLLALIVQKCQ
jgi:hypothetical protein